MKMFLGSEASKDGYGSMDGLDVMIVFRLKFEFSKTIRSVVRSMKG